MTHWHKRTAATLVGLSFGERGHNPFKVGDPAIMTGQMVSSAASSLVNKVMTVSPLATTSSSSPDWRLWDLSNDPPWLGDCCVKSRPERVEG